MTTARPAVTAMLVAASLVLAAAQAPDRTRAEDLARKATDRMRALQREADAIAVEERSVLGELERLELERQQRRRELQDYEQQIAQTTSALDETERRLASLEQTAADQRPALAARLVQLYKLGRPGYARLVLGVEDLRTIGRAYRLVASFARRDRAQVDEHEATLEAARTARLELGERRERLLALQANAQRVQAELDSAIASRTRLVARLDARRDLNAQLAGELQQAQQRLQMTLANMTFGRPIGTVALPLEPFMGDLAWPLPGRIVSRFGTERHPRLGTTIVRNGIEIAADEGKTVRAVHDGLVAFASDFVGFGNLVILDHGNQAYSLYGYLSSLTVGPGATVHEGDAVGLSGRAPAGDPSLYFELRIDGKPVDPVQWLRE